MLEAGGARLYDELREQIVADCEELCAEGDRIAVDRDRYVLVLATDAAATTLADRLQRRFARRATPKVDDGLRELRSAVLDASLFRQHASDLLG